MLHVSLCVCGGYLVLGGENSVNAPFRLTSLFFQPNRPIPDNLPLDLFASCALYKRDEQVFNSRPSCNLKIGLTELNELTNNTDGINRKTISCLLVVEAKQRKV